MSQRGLLGRRIVLALMMASTMLLVSSPALAVTGVAWHRASQIRLPADTHMPQDAELNAVTCTGDGACVAGGYYYDNGAGLGRSQAMVTRQSQGRWSRAAKLKLPANVYPATPNASVDGISCVSMGNCIAVGQYQVDASYDDLPFVATETRGVWHRAWHPALPSNASRPADAFLTSVACMKTGACEAVGGYRDSAGKQQGMAMSKPARGRWHQAVEISAPANSATDPYVFMTGLTCTRYGSCVAVGNYDVPASSGTSSVAEQALGVIQHNGAWRQAVFIKAPANRLGSGYAFLRSVSCLAGGGCVAVGGYQTAAGTHRALTVAESGLSFGRSREIKALPANPGTSPSTTLESISCGSTGVCVAGGYFQYATGKSAPLSMTRTPGGNWRNATLIKLPASTASGVLQNSMIYGVSCTATMHCSSVGYFRDSAGGYRALAAWTG